MKEELKNFERCVLPYVNEISESKKYSKDICRELSSPFSEHLNLDLVYDLVKNICENQVNSKDNTRWRKSNITCICYHFVANEINIYKKVEPTSKMSTENYHINFSPLN